MTPEFTEFHALDVGPLSYLSHDTLGINGFRRVFFWALGYIIIRVQVEGIGGYDEDQVALVIPDSTGFGSQVPVTLGTSTVNQIINVIKKSEINELSVSLNGSRIAWLMACWWAGLLIQRKTTTNQTVDPTDYNETVKMTKGEEVDALSSKIICGQTKTLLFGNNMHVMTQSQKGGNGPHLPHGLSVVNTCTKVISGRKWVAVVVKNLMAILITVTMGVKVTQVVAMNVVPPVEIAPRTLEKLDKIQGIQWTRMTVREGRNCSSSSRIYLA